MVRRVELTDKQAKALVRTYKSSPELQLEFGNFQIFAGFLHGMLSVRVHGFRLPHELRGVFPDVPTEDPPKAS